MDKTYRIYESADRDFYNSLTLSDRITEIRRIGKPLAKGRIQQTQEAYRLQVEKQGDSHSLWSKLVGSNSKNE